MDLAAIETERARLHDQYIRAERPSSSARGIHHTALLSSDVERTIRFYQGVLEFPLTEIIENRDYQGSNHFFFDVGNGNLLAFFDFPGLDLGPYAEVLGGLHHLAISVTREKWTALRANLDAAGIEYKEESGGALYGLAIGDALGMPTQMLSRAEIVRRWGPLLPGFEPAPPGHPIAGGMPAGTVTDDTEQAVLLARLLVKGRGIIEPHELAAALTEWERAMAERGSLDLLGPSTRRAVAAILAGVPPEEAGTAGTTNGAAMRIAPVGIAVGVGDPGTRPALASVSALVDRTVM